MNSRSLALSHRRRLRQAAMGGGAAVLAVTLGVFASPSGTPSAQASPAASGVAGCQQLFPSPLCMWQNSNYSGTRWVYPLQGEPDGYWWYVGDAANDQISSIYNGELAYVFVAKNCPADSDWTWLGAAYQAPNLANNKWPDGSGMNDSISAYGIAFEAHPQFPDHGARTAGGC
jgi:hypothetical protein